MRVMHSGNWGNFSARQIAHCLELDQMAFYDILDRFSFILKFLGPEDAFNTPLGFWDSGYLFWDSLGDHGGPKNLFKGAPPVVEAHLHIAGHTEFSPVVKEVKQKPSEGIEDVYMAYSLYHNSTKMALHALGNCLKNKIDCLDSTLPGFDICCLVHTACYATNTSWSNVLYTFCVCPQSQCSIALS